MAQAQCGGLIRLCAGDTTRRSTLATASAMQWRLRATNHLLFTGEYFVQTDVAVCQWRSANGHPGPFGAEVQKASLSCCYDTTSYLSCGNHPRQRDTCSATATERGAPASDLESPHRFGGGVTITRLT